MEKSLQEIFDKRKTLRQLLLYQGCINIVDDFIGVHNYKKDNYVCVL